LSGLPHRRPRAGELASHLAGRVRQEEFLANISWLTSRGDSFGNISHVTEPILVYAKDRKSLRLPIVHSPTKNDHQFTNLDGDPAGPWRSQIKAGRNREHRYPIQDYTAGEFVLPKYYFDKGVLRRKQIQVGSEQILLMRSRSSCHRFQAMVFPSLQVRRAVVSKRLPTVSPS